MQDNLNQVDTNAELRKLYDGKFKPVFDALKSRIRNVSELQAANLASDVHIPGVAPYLINKLVLEFFKSLEGLELGRLVVGRRGKPTRFVWSERKRMLDVLAAATGKGRVEVAARNGSLATPREQAPIRGDVVSYQFVLRPGLIARFELPHDFSQPEAERLCKFIQSLPLEYEAKT
jgi:hypothetical protein